MTVRLGVVVDNHLTMTTHVNVLCRVRQSRPLIRSLSSDAAGPDVNLNTPGLLQLTTLRGHLQPVPTPISRAQRRRTPHH